jgi:hypothetical protein
MLPSTIPFVQQSKVIIFEYNIASTCNNIHFFWDAAGFLCPILNGSTSYYADDLEKNVTKLKNQFPPPTYPNLNSIDFEYWRNKTFDIAY